MGREYRKHNIDSQQLLSQFGIGITLLYCLWATPPSFRSEIYQSPRIPTTVRTCSVILAVFAEHWRQAEPLRDLFDILSESIPSHPLSATGGTETYDIPIQTINWIQSMIPTIMSLVVNRDICRMITEMISKRDPWQDTGYSDRITAWSWEDSHLPHECHLCQNQRESDREAEESYQVNDELPMENIAGGPLDVLPDELLSFPGLFGSVEF